MYQAARVLKNANDIIENLTNKLELIADAVEFIRAKVDTATDHMGAVTKFVSGTVGKMVMGKLEKSFEEKVKEKPKKEKKKRKTAKKKK